MKQNKRKIVKILLTLLVVIFMIYIVIKIIPYFAQIATEEGRILLKKDIENLGRYGIFVILLLMIAQIFFAFLPGEPVEILAGMCYGTIGGLFVIYLGVFISTCLIMLLIRVFGKKIIYELVEKEKIEKLENSKIFKSNKIELILILLFALPGTPKDLITYVGCFLPIKPIRFVLICTLARFPSIVSSTIVGNNILEGNWLFIVIVYAITIVVSGIAIYFFNYKTNKENINE